MSDKTDVKILRVIKITPLENMASGVKFCALVGWGMKRRTGFGLTEKEAIEVASDNVRKNK